MVSFSAMHQMASGSIESKSDVSTKIELTYSYLIRNLDTPTLELIENKIQKLDAASIDQLTVAVKAGNLRDKIFANADDSYYLALAAFKLNKISAAEFATISFSWSLRQHHKCSSIKIIPLFNKYGTVCTHARNIIKQTLKVSPFTAAESRYGSTFLDDHKLDLFFRSMKEPSVPLLDQMFFTFKNLRDEPPPRMTDEYLMKVLSNEVTITHAISTGPGINVFSSYKTKSNQNRRMFPSFTMMQNFVKIAYPESYVTILPEIYISKAEDFERYGTTQTRPMALPCPDKALPSRVDELPATESYDVIYHDFFHVIVASNIPSNSQKAYILVAKLINEISVDLNRRNHSIKAKESVEFLQKFLGCMYERALDLEFYPKYKADLINHESFNFWLGVSQIAKMARDRFFMQYLPKGQQDISTYISTSILVENSLNTCIANVNIIEMLCKKAVEAKKEFRSLGISFKVIQELAELEYNLSRIHDVDLQNHDFFGCMEIVLLEKTIVVPEEPAASYCQIL